MPNFPDQFGNNKNNFNQGPPSNFYPPPLQMQPPPYNMGPMMQMGPNQFVPSMEEALGFPQGYGPQGYGFMPEDIYGNMMGPSNPPFHPNHYAPGP